ncbi:hypothetical protein [Bradyrhizobium sp. RT3a]|uniref:tetratricopeptide repeat protein n=1 Tax=Bradyrhizobium sp. RT3a TaxID=3156333 RepID=UPI00339A554F
MHELPKDIRRRLIPRWRRVKDTPNEELTSAKPSVMSSEFQSEFKELKDEWLARKDVLSASELLYAAALGYEEEAVRQAAHFVIETPGVSAGLKRLAMGRLPPVPQSSPPPVDHKQTFEIRALKSKLVEQPRNAHAHIELARAYVSVGLNDKAKHHVRIAIELAPVNRFVLRTAARFDVHRGRVARSIKALENVAPHDPWVAATLVALADLSGTSVKRIKPIRELLDRTTNPVEKSELAAALGTLELKDAGIRKARKYFQVSAVSPNENVVAQLFWLSKNFGVNFDQKLLERSEAFEARAQSSADANDWTSAVEACFRWLENEPFAIRPAFEGGYIASEMLGDFKAALEFAHRGLASNPKDIGLMNNLAFALIMEDDLIKSKEWLDRAKHLLAGDHERERAVLQATEGLLLYRQGNVFEAAEHYTSTIKAARGLKNEKLLQIAYLHFCYEELRIGHAPPFWSSDELTKFFTGDDANKDAKVVFQRMVLPMLVARQKYGLIGAGYGAPLPIWVRPT